MENYENEILKAQQLKRLGIQVGLGTTKEHFVKSVVDDLRKSGLGGDDLFEKAKEQLSGGRWEIIHDRHVYIKDNELEKARGGVYKNTDENHKKGIVGQKYGNNKEEDKSKNQKLPEGYEIRKNLGGWSLDKKENGHWLFIMKQRKKSNLIAFANRHYEEHKSGNNNG